MQASLDSGSSTASFWRRRRGRGPRRDGVHVFMLLSAWSSLTTERRIQRPYFAPIRRTIASVGESESHTNFRFKKDQLGTLKDALGFPDEIHAGNRLTFGGEECMLFMLRRMRCVQSSRATVVAVVVVVETSVVTADQPHFVLTVVCSRVCVCPPCLCGVEVET